jgi:hypothetical protein
VSDFDAIDFFRDDSVVVDPYPYFEYLRDECPVRAETHQDVVMVTGYEEVMAVLHDTDTFSSANTVTGPFPGFPVPLVGDDVSALIEEYRDQLPMSDQLPNFDPPHHTAHRALLMRLITPKRLKENEDFMWRLADRQIDEFLAKGECEFIHDYAGPFAMLVIADLLGVPESDHEMFRARLAGPRSAIGSTGDDTLTLTGAQLDAILIGGGTINLGSGTDTINLTSTSTQLNILGPTDASITGVEVFSFAGAASGVNNAVSRVAGLLAIAVFGVVLARTFDARVRPPLDRLALSPVAKDALQGELRKIAGADVAQVTSIPPSERPAVRAAIEDGFVFAFRLVMFCAAALALAAAAFGSAIAGRSGP